MTLKVFISSTFVDLKEYRKAAIEVVNRYKSVPLAMEFFMSQASDPETVCKDEIEECDLFIGIYAHRYGWVPDGQEKSITQQEYELAKTLGKDILCFVVQDTFAWNPKFFEFKKYDQLNAFLDIVKTDKVVSFFTTPVDFKDKCSASFGKYLAQKKAETKPDKEKTRETVPIPLAPTPYIAHPYALPDHFLGRVREQAMLSNWFHNEAEPVLVMEAIGGMGKSALTWAWMQREILAKSEVAGIDGVFWWSFYEAPFDEFLKQLTCYALDLPDSCGSILSGDLTKLWAVLHYRKFLIVLDGLERALRGYSGMTAMYIQEEKFKDKATAMVARAQWDRVQREPVHPLAARFLQHLTAATMKSKTLITTRLVPWPLEKLSGVKFEHLTGLSSADMVRFFLAEGIKGVRGDMELAGQVYGNHPLMLKLLTTAIQRNRTKDIREAFRLKIINQEEPQKILATSYQLLSEEERQVVSVAAVFRGVFTFEPLKALLPDIEENVLWEVLMELRSLGFLFYDERTDHFDFHPIMRSFLYDNLTGRDKVHNRAVEYFKALPAVEKIVSLDDLAPVIELYHHLVKAGKFDEAIVLFRSRLRDPCYSQLSAYHLIIDLLKELFPDGDDENQLPRLKMESAQAWTLNEMANACGLSGQPIKAVPLYLKQSELREKNDENVSLAIGLGNAAQDQLIIGQLSAAAAHLQKSIALCREIEDESWEAVSHQELSRVLAYRGLLESEKKLSEVFELFKELFIENRFNKFSAYLSLFSLFKSRLAIVLPGQAKPATNHIVNAISHALKALKFVEKFAATSFPLPRDFVRAYWLLGESLVQCKLIPGDVKVESFVIHFYDEHFQQVTETLAIDLGNLLPTAERCLNEALRRCRSVNLVEQEPNILTALALLHWAKAPTDLAPIEELLKESHQIATRSGYRLYLTDIHLLAAQVLLKLQTSSKLLGLSAKEHLAKTKEFAMDVSQLSDLYQSKDPDFYKGIPEYDMLKRGMADEERIKNGYYVAYQIADALERQYSFVDE